MFDFMISDFFILNIIEFILRFTNINSLTFSFFIFFFIIFFSLLIFLLIVLFFFLFVI